MIALTGFSDAGGAVAQLEEYFWGNSGLETLVTFDTDQLYDYRARRPTIVFNGEHLGDYDAPELALFLAKDDLEHPFLLLMGVEPDFRWEGFVSAMQSLVADYQVASMTWVHSIPMPVPHTRPTAVTVSGTRTDLIEARSVWKPTTQISATAGHLLELRLMDRGLDVTGFALLIPHYLAENEYPTALLAALESIMSSTGLILPTDEVRERGREMLARIDEQIAGNPDSVTMVSTLEQRHDAYMRDLTLRSPLVSDDGTLPTADQLGGEFERFLQDQRGEDTPPFGGFPDAEQPNSGE